MLVLASKSSAHYYRKASRDTLGTRNCSSHPVARRDLASFNPASLAGMGGHCHIVNNCYMSLKTSRIKLEAVEELMCPMDSIAEFIFVHSGKASRVHDCMRSLLWLCLQLHPHSGEEPMRWTGRQCPSEPEVHGEELKLGVGWEQEGYLKFVLLIKLCELIFYNS